MPATRLVGSTAKIRSNKSVSLWISIVIGTITLLPMVASAQTPAAHVVRIPLTIDYLALSAAFKQQLYTDHGRAPLWNGADKCQYFYAESPEFSRQASNVKLETLGNFSLGVAMGDQCVGPVTWNGIIEAETAPYMAPHLQLKFRVSDVNLYNSQHEKTLIAGQGFDLVKQNFIPRLETFSFDLSPAFQNFQDLVKAGAPPEIADRVQQTLATLRAEPELRAEDNGVRAMLDLTVPPFPAIPIPPAPAQLTPNELAAFEKKLDQWDAFLVFAIKQLGETSKDSKLRDDLLNLLLDSRQRLVTALAHPESGGPDPIRLLFLDQWQRLGQIVRDAAQRGTLGSQSLQFFSFMSAGDALFALDQAAPALGIKISAENLRRLAHMIGPAKTGDPLSFNFNEDPELQKMFRVKPPLASEGPLDTAPSTTVMIPEATASGNASATPTEAVSNTPVEAVLSTAGPPVAPTATPTLSPVVPSPFITPSPLNSLSPSPESTPTSSPISWLRIPRLLLTPDDANAGEIASIGIDVVAKLQELAKALKRVVVDARNATQYRTNVGELLQYGAQREIKEENIDYRYRPLYTRVVKATAWQESCWRQFVLDGNRVTYLESSTHDIGLMQVNKYVWRGFYNIDRLKWDVLYNANTGMEILARLLEGTELKRGAFSAGNPDELARSIYAAYNGGPSSYRRWRRREPHLQRVIDNSFWAKYQAVSQGKQIDIISCAAEWGSSH
jgi:hypothetical protein